MALEELYREVILDHYRSPRNRQPLGEANAVAEGSNPLCGDDVRIELLIEGDEVTAIGVTGHGCSISQASGSMMGDAVKGRSIEAIRTLTGRFKGMMSIDGAGDPGLDPSRPGAVLGDLEALQGVRKFPVRIKCANLPWTTLEQAIKSFFDS
ncbi:Fe-S cluster assembly sulfur transfer protein SufU [Candidatus Spongiisocius sp.]|uniref:Fe-S cluster assembly sulfur transfer protein SufU n=1 Tax=Candidatus Spongiisocius sp. TaxID=3101273 RepID=UPI003B58D29F